MINIAKSNNVPACLAQTSDHKCCIEQVQEEFFHKCYICENKNLTDIETEHFNPDPTLRLDWNNLFYSCGHCNGIKSNKYTGMLNCTNFSVIITDVIQFELKPIPKENPVFTSLNDSSSVSITVELLNEVHSPSTITRKLEANNLNDLICGELIKFTNKISKFYKANSPEKKAAVKNELKDMLHVSSKFVAFKIWIIKTNANRLNDFQDIIPKFII
ncbi:MAG: hypothetical protein O9282_04480 [Flavobacterium sp.]|jgi:hypothetical protein|uniref:hypothetical protein n=1 Tax=Flavobacterium sp. TaxID=239 RepID=UPI0022C35D51|nr:hypothetical protein [Flavobacterium sp.]MCZ8089982.1 hypothetical protein [Flavobacterium sp.]MCZ8330551.1 hypothetical protein [Flavobacterium sp.]